MKYRDKSNKFFKYITPLLYKVFGVLKKEKILSIVQCIIFMNDNILLADITYTYYIYAYETPGTCI